MAITYPHTRHATARVRLTAALTAAALTAAAVLVVLAGTSRARADEAAAWTALSTGGIVLFRHATAPGFGDPKGFRLGDCATQRNLDAVGQAEARRIGAAFRTRGVAVGKVLTSQWCRARETAELAFPGRIEDAPAFNSFFGDRASAPGQTRAAREILKAWRGPGALVVTTHQVNIQALAGRTTRSGEGIVLIADGDALRVVGSIRVVE